MRYKNTVTALVFSIVILASTATLVGIFSDNGQGPYPYRSIRGKIVNIYGKGLYQHMSEEVAIQGIAQDIVTFFVGNPLLLISLFFALKSSLKSRIVLSGTLAYFLVTYAFYLNMAMYNVLFLIYAALMGLSFFGLAIVASTFDLEKLREKFQANSALKFAGIFLIFNAIAIGILWLGIVVPPLVDGTLYPKTLEHYTTLIVQGNDLVLLIPLEFVSGYLFLNKKRPAFLLAPVYLVFLSLLMTALVAKVAYMGVSGYNTFPVVIIIPAFAIISIVCSVLTLRDVHQD
jgi:hypothetical protein